MLFFCSAEDKEVFHIDNHNSLINEFFEDVVHLLEHLWTVSETKEHDQGLEQAFVHPKGCPPFIPLLDSYILYPQQMSSSVKYFALASDTLLRISGNTWRG